MTVSRANPAVFLRVLDDTEKAMHLLELCKGSATHKGRFNCTIAELQLLPNTPFAYWVSDSIRRLFQSSVTGEYVETRRGMASLDDFRFVRLTSEILPISGWERYAKGESQRPYSDQSTCVVNWRHRGREVKAYVEAKVGSASRTIQAESFYFRPGLTWIRRTSRLRMRCLPSGFIFSGGAQAAFVVDDSDRMRLAFLALANSTAFDALIKLSVGRTGDAVQFEPGMIAGAPWPSLACSIDALAQHAAVARRRAGSLDTAVEASHAFVLPAVLQVAGQSFGMRCSAWSARVAEVEDELGRVQSAIDELCFELYGISDEDRRAIVEGFAVTDDHDETGGGTMADTDSDGVDEALVELDPAGLAAGLLSWAVGVAVGRFDSRFALGERDWPDEPDPFAPLPVCSPAVLIGDDGLPVMQPPIGYPVRITPVLVDDPGHELDITRRARSVFEAVFREEADAWWSDVGAAVGGRDGEVGGWFAKGFFDHHLKTYSRSRRKAPVLWPIGTKSGSYLVWLYAHQVSADSLFQVLHDVVAPKLTVEDRELSQLRQTAGTNPSASQRKAIEAQDRFVAELRELRDELEAVTPLWAPDLNDGIVVVLAPLWRLFAHHRTWSNELKKHWAKLEKGEYDWAQLAMDLWPERVVRKCAEDRSLAIAHRLEDVFWIQDPENGDKWHSRSETTIAIDQLVAQRHNPATAGALQRLST